MISNNMAPGRVQRGLNNSQVPESRFVELFHLQLLHSRPTAPNLLLSNRSIPLPATCSRCPTPTVARPRTGTTCSSTGQPSASSNPALPSPLAAVPLRAARRGLVAQAQATAPATPLATTHTRLVAYVIPHRAPRSACSFLIDSG